MSSTAVTSDGDSGLIRVTPQQGRSHATLEKLERAIRETLRDPDVGRDRFTTGQVAVVAGVSIGTVYRYFPDRTAMLEHIWPSRGDTFLPAEADLERESLEAATADTAGTR